MYGKMSFDHCLVNTNGLLEEEEYLLDFNIPDLEGCFRDLLDLPDELSSWRCQQMSQWSNYEVIDFIRNEISYMQNFPQRVHIDRFQSISGDTFQSLTLENCQLLCDSAQEGEFIYKCKERYLRSQNERLYGCDSIFNPISPLLEYNFEDSTSEESSCTESLKAQNEYTPRKPGRPRIKPDKNQGRRSQKIWEFLIHLLQDEKTCPKLVKWEDPQEGTFKFVQTEKVAQLWGSRKKNSNMTYEKFSRAMRYYYKSKILLPVPGKRLVYKFGPQAKGWRIEVPQC